MLGSDTPCHPLMLNSVTIDFSIDPVGSCVRIEGAAARCRQDRGGNGGPDGGIGGGPHHLRYVQGGGPGMEIRSVGLQRKSGGNSGSWQRVGRG